MKNELDPSEKIIEEEALSYKKVSDLKKKKIETIIENSSKKKVITLRLNENDLERIKSIAESEGIPYQTLISSVMHKYVKNRLVDKNEIFKVSELINTNGWK
ncbi:MAG: antitoxin [Actinobacteria bacterium]|nr:antitoxin [Actinomycetota bacterium]